MSEPLRVALRKPPILKGPKLVFDLKPGRSDTPAHKVISELLVVIRQNEDMGFDICGAKPFLFDAEFQRFVGSALPMGVGEHRPAMISLVQRWANDEWEVVASYLDGKYPALLWREASPTWAKVE